MLNKDLVDYVEEHIIPKYNTFDKAHDEIHVRQVISNSLEMAEEYKVDKNIIYAAAAYHDLGLAIERPRHQFFSKDIMLADKKLDEFFSPDEKEIIAGAILTHRASCETEPETLYGKIIADADNDLDPGRIIERMVLYSIDHYTDLDKEGHLKRCFHHGIEKYSEKGYLSLYLDSENNRKNLKEIRRMIDEKEPFIEKFEEYYDKYKA